MSQERSDTEEEIIGEVKRLLDEPYKQAKATHIWAEEVTGTHNWLAMTNFRDSLDHMSKIFQKIDSGDIEGAREDLAEMEAHIHRAAYDSAQSATEQKLKDAYSKRLPASVYSVLLLDHMGDDEYHQREDRIADRMSKGRERKADSLEQSIKHFRAAHEHAKRMERGTPSKKQVGLNSAIIFGVLSSVVSISLVLLQ